jgi:cytochrome c biogenesis protein ResB
MSTEPLPAVQRHTPGPVELLWRWLNSLPIAIVVMLALALLSAIGTMVPQVHLAQPAPGTTFDQLLAERYGDRVAVIKLLGFHDIYKTWYFNALLIWLAVSAVICNIVRFQRTVDLYKNPPVRRGRAFFSADKRSLSAPVGGAETAEQFAAALRERGYRVRRDDTGSAVCVYADRGFTRKWALVLLHVAVLIVIFGGMYGKAVGVEGLIQMADGEQTVLKLDMLKGKRRFIQPLLANLPPLEYDLNQHSFRIDYLRKIELETGLKEMPPELQEYHRYSVDDFVSQLTASHNGKTITREVKVNHPLTIEKLRLYQSSYIQQGYLSTTFGGQTQEMQLPPAGTLYVFTPQGLMPRDMAMGMPMSAQGFEFEQVKAGDVYHGDAKQGSIGPMTLAHMYDARSGEYLGSQLVTTDKAIVTSIGGEVISAMMSPKVDNFSVFSYQRDPGAPILLFGWLSLVLGIALTLYIPFTQVWVRVDGAKSHFLASGPDGRPGTRLMERINAMLKPEGTISADPGQ